MTTYSAVLSTEIDSDSPVTDTLMGKLAGNPVAIGEADASVPLGLLPTVLLGTLTTTSGATQTLSSLVLTPYKGLRLVFNGVSVSAGAYFYVGVTGLRSATLSSGTELIYGFCDIDLETGSGTAVSAYSTTASAVTVAATGYSTATTSISVTTSSGTFDAGNIKIYGLK